MKGKTTWMEIVALSRRFISMIKTSRAGVD